MTSSNRRSARALAPLLALAFAFSASVAQAQGAAEPAKGETTKIGFVNVDRIVQEAAPAKAASAKIDAEFAKRDKELTEMGARLKAAGEKLERDNAVLQESERNRRQREVGDMDRELQRRQREFREDLNQRRNEELAQIFEKTQRVIKQIAEQEKFDIVIRDAIFVNNRIDITDKVIRALSASPSASAAPTLAPGK